MNHIYRSIWSEALKTWIAVSENTKAKSKNSTACHKLLVTGLLLCSANGWALPTGEQVVAGQATVSTPTAGQMQIQQNSQQAVINWQGFSINGNETVNILQPNASAALLNRVVGQDASLIQGHLNANGLVYLINPNGVLFSKTAQVDVGGLVAGTHNISNANFLNGLFHFSQDNASGTVSNQGYIKTPAGGVVALIGQHVSNEGKIETPNGTTVLAAAKTVDLDFKGDGLVEVEVPEAVLNAQIENKGAILADGGRVVLTAQAAGQLTDTVINQSGVIRAQGLVERNGEIILEGGNGTALIAGTLDASAPNVGDGGFIETSAAHVKVADSAHVTTLAANGNNGTWLIDPVDFTIAASGGDMTGAAVRAALSGGNFSIQSSNGGAGVNGDVNVNDVVSWAANKLTLNAEGNININANLNGSSTAQLALQYGQGAVAVGNTSRVVTTGASVNLSASTTNFTTKQGSDGVVKNYTVITSLGSAGSTTKADLQGMNGDRTLNYALGADIDASSTSTWNGGEGFLPIGASATPFSGNFNGLGHSITGLNIVRPTADYVGLLGFLSGNSSIISNLGLINANIKGQNYVGGLAGYIERDATGSLINNIHSSGDVSGSSFVGGLVGWNNILIDNAYSTASVTADINVGGLVGYNYGFSVPVIATIKNSYATGNVNALADHAGGLVGYNTANIAQSYATGDVTSANHAGGLVGGNEGQVNNVYATGSVKAVSSSAGTGIAGGLVGQNYASGVINNAYATGKVNASYKIGGLVAWNEGSINNAYATGNIPANGASFVGGLVGYDVGTTTNSFWDTESTGQSTTFGGGSGKSSLDLVKQLTYTTAGWDFTNTWWMSEGNTRPFLRMEHSTNITNAHQLQLMAMDTNSNVKVNYTLANNLDLTAELANASGMWTRQGFVPIGNGSVTAGVTNTFNGSFDGLSHTITGLSINRSTTDNVGLFGFTWADSVVKNIGLIGVTIQGRDNVGGIAGSFSGWNNTISNAYVTGTVTGNNLVGGLAGFIAYADSATKSVSNSYSTADVSGNSSVGGLVGDLTGGNILNTYAIGKVTGSGNVGGLVGTVDQATIRGSFWTTETTTQNKAVGTTDLVSARSTVEAAGLITSDMKVMANFDSPTILNGNRNPNWSIRNTGGGSTVWRLYQDHTLPLLTSFMSPVTLSDAPDALVKYNGTTQSGGSTAVTGLQGSAASGFNAGFYNGYYSDQQGFDITGGNLIITPTALTITAAIIGNPSKVYDGTDIAHLTSGNYSLSGFFGTDGATITKTIGQYNSKDVGMANTVNVSLTASDFNLKAGTLFGNYNFPVSASGAGVITPATLNGTIIGAPSKVYDGTDIASLANSNYQLAGFFGTDGAIVNKAIGQYNSKDVATANSITVSLIPGDFSPKAGTLLSNYYFPTSITGAASITPANLTITANDASKNYDGSAYTGGNGVFYTGLVNNETGNVLSGTLAYSGNSQGAINKGSYTITPQGLSSSNYQISYQDGTLNIVESTPENPPQNPPVDDSILGSVVAPANNSPSTSTSPSATSTGSSGSSNTSKTTKSSSSSSSSTTGGSSNASTSGTGTGTGDSSATTVNDVSDDFGGKTTTQTDNKQSPGVSLAQEQSHKNFVQPTLMVKNSAGRVNRLQMSTNKKFLSLLLENGSVRIWDFERGVQRQIEPQDKQPLTDIGGVNDKGDLLSIASKANIGAYDVISSTADASINESDVNHFVTSTDGDLLLVNTGANILSLWHNKAHKELWQTVHQRGEINGLALSNNKRYGAVLSHQQGAYVLPVDLELKQLTDAVDIVDLSSGKIVKSLPNLAEQVVYMQFKDNDTLQVGLASGEILDWSIASGSAKKVAVFAEPITAVDTAKNSYAYVLNDGTVRVGDGQGQIKLSVKNQENPFRYAMLLEDGKKLLTVMTSGDVSLWDVESGKKMLRLFSLQQGWTVMDAFGRFDGSEEALENFTWLANQESLPLDNFSENYYEPGLLANVLKNQDYLNSNLSAVKAGIGLPPKVSLQLDEQQLKGDSVTLQLDVYDRGGGINKINVYQNGKILSNENVIVKQQTVTENEAEHRILTLNISPGPGKNTLKVTASSQQGIENSSTELSFDGKTKAYSSSLRFLTVGINRYSDSRLNLDYSVADASLIGKVIATGSKISLSKSLYNEDATKLKILAELKELSQGVQQDVLVIYFAGHGLALGKEWYFLPYESKLQSSLEKIAATGITATELSDIFKSSKIQHILLMVDSCYSGAGMDAFSKLENGQRYFTRQLSRTLGITVLTAAAKNQGAAELKSLGHGLFTYLITQELQKKGDAATVTAHSITTKIVKELPVFSKKVAGIIQEPAAYTHGSDFILSDVLK